jgi:hypothetical protein
VARLNPNLAKLHRTYTVEEVARLFGVHRNTVRNWLKAGLKVIDDRRPLMIQGSVLRAFLQARREAARRRCPPGTLYCFRCRVPRPPAEGCSYTPETGRVGMLRASCGVCGTCMFRRARQADLEAILPFCPVLVVQGESHIAECLQPFSNCAQEWNGLT